MSTVAVPIQPNAKQQVETHLQILGEWTSFSGPRPPLFVPSDQLYYWTRRWQDGENEALVDLEAGRSRVFDNVNELARYLIRPPE